MTRFLVAMAAMAAILSLVVSALALRFGALEVPTAQAQVGP